MTRTILILLAILILLSACGPDPLGIVARSQVEAAAQVQTEQIRADAQVQTARIDASTARVRVGGWMVGALLAAVVVVLIAGIAAATVVRVNQDKLMADLSRPTLQAPAQRTALAPGRPVSRRPTLPFRQPTLALPERSERDTDIVVIDA